jgi:hypothetical protein
MARGHGDDPSRNSARKRAATAWLAALLTALLLLQPGRAFGQARGQVLSIGFNNHYRPDAWTPMLVQLTSQGAESATYQIQIVQEDLDRDRVVYTQMETLGGNVESKPATTENFWVYFRPKPTEAGLPDATDVTSNLNTLNAQLKVFLCNKDGKQLAALPMTSTILSVDPRRSMGDTARSRKLILFVTDGTDRPLIPDYAAMKGVLEDVDAVVVQPRDLPSNVLGYEGVDAIVWLDADANFLISGTRTPSLEAIVQWVRQGGHLVICQPNEPNKIKPFADLLPVGAQVNGEWTIPMVDRDDIGVLRRIAAPLVDRPWPVLAGPFKVARVPALAGAKVDEWLEWTDGDATSFTPWLARRGVGLGAVTWVAQNLGNPAITRVAKTGWRYVWDRVFDWNNAAASDVPEDYQAPLAGLDPWNNAEGLDLGRSLLSGMDLTSTAATYLLIAGLFLFIYFLIAGPGSYLFLASRKRAQLSWFAFALAAVVATGLTVVLIKAVVRGPPRLQHLSVVRYAQGEPNGVINSRFGLYIRQDGIQKIALGDTAPHEVSYITPFAIHPQYLNDEDVLPAYLEYQIPVPDASENLPVSVSIPYRSTSKKLQTHWVGEVDGRVEVPVGLPDVKLVMPGYIDGTLVNHSGYDLSDVYFAFEEPASPEHGKDLSMRDQIWLAYDPLWPRDAQLKLQDVMSRHNLITASLDPARGRVPGGADPAYAQIGRDQPWERYWRQHTDELTNSGGDFKNVLPMLTLFDLLPPWRTDPNEREARFELYRRSGRHLDLSPAISAGELVVCGVASINGDTSKNPLPVPLSVSESPVTGTGTTIMQYVLPLDRSAMEASPTTQPINR